MAPPVYAVMPPTLKDLLGHEVSFAQLMTREHIEACQAVIDTAGVQFFDAALGQLAQAEELLALRQRAGQVDVIREAKLRGVVRSLQTEAEMLGFPLLMRGSAAMLAMLQASNVPADKQQELLRVVLQMLRFICSERLQDADNPVAAECLGMLDQYVLGIPD